MSSTYYYQADALDESFITKIRQQYGDKMIKITIQESDETEYLMSSPANHTHLLQAIEDVRLGKNLISVNIDDYIDDNEIGLDSAD